MAPEAAQHRHASQEGPRTVPVLFSFWCRGGVWRWWNHPAVYHICHMKLTRFNFSHPASKSWTAVRGSGPRVRLRPPPLYVCQAGRRPLRPSGRPDSFSPSPPTRSRQFCREAAPRPGAAVRLRALPPAGSRDATRQRAERPGPAPRGGRASPVAPPKTRRSGLCAPHAPPAAAGSPARRPAGSRLPGSGRGGPSGSGPRPGPGVRPRR